jgi:hypothetical protein
MTIKFVNNIIGDLRAYTDVIKQKLSKIKFPILCNWFSVFKEAAGGGHYFGEDFMFPTAGAF